MSLVMLLLNYNRSVKNEINCNIIFYNEIVFEHMCNAISIIKAMLFSSLRSNFKQIRESY